MQLGMPFYQKGRGNYCFQNVKYEMPIKLAGKSIMVLRPVKQSEQLCKLVIDHGGTGYRSWWDWIWMIVGLVMDHGGTGYRS